MRWGLALIWIAPLVAADSGEFFETRVRPVLAKNCFSCHTTAKMGGLEMKSRESLLKGGNSGAAITPGQPDDSLLIQVVRQTHARLKMPPTGKLNDEEITDLAAWVKDGAVWPEAPARRQEAFWSLQPVRKPDSPKVKDKSWPKAPIDLFILSALEARGLRPVRPADKRVLIRRATYDLIGLPPTPEEVDAFLKDSSRNAFAKVVDRLLASPHYGERWGRHWLDIARYSDDKLNSTQDEPFQNAFRYRDWVIQAFNQDMPYDLFVKAQIAGDLLPEPDKYAAGLGFYALRPEFTDDRVDATTRGFLGLTVACAQCHDHKFDPIPTKDYYSLLGVFMSTENRELPLAPADEVAEYKKKKKKVDDQEAAIKEFIQTQSAQLGEILAAQTSKYLMGARSREKPADLDAEALERWGKYLNGRTKEHSYLKAFEEARSGEEAQEAADAFQDLVLAVLREKKEVDEKNLILLGGNKERRNLANANLVSLERDKYFLWRDLFSERRGNLSFTFNGGVLYYGEKQIDRFLHGQWKAHLESLRAGLEALKKDLPPQYPFLHAIKDVAKPSNQRVQIRGSRDNLGEEAPRRFLAALTHGEPRPFTHGAGRLELAEAIANANNPLTARVMVNRIWQHHFGQGLVRTPSNFGQLGDRPSHPELLDYLAARFVESGWSMKAMHREIMLSAVYALSTVEQSRDPSSPGRRSGAQTPGLADAVTWGPGGAKTRGLGDTESRGRGGAQTRGLEDAEMRGPGGAEMRGRRGTGAGGGGDSASREESADPDNRLLWRANRQRLDAEELRDALLFVSGKLDPAAGGPPQKLSDDNNRRTVYGFVSRRKLDPFLALFDFPNPTSTSEQRIVTNVPLQRLFFLNSSFIARQAEALASRLGAGSEETKIRRMYRLLFGRDPDRTELQLGLQFVRAEAEAWPKYAQVLLSSNEFLFVN